MVLADGVDIAVELKSDLSTGAELERGLKQLRSVKLLTRQKSPLLLENRKPVELRKLARKIPTFLFCMKAAHNPLDMCGRIIEHYRANDVSSLQQIDHLVINQVGILSNYKQADLSKAEGKSTGFFFEEWRQHTLAAFVLKMNESFAAAPVLTEAILRRYLRQIRPYAMFRVS